MTEEQRQLDAALQHPQVTHVSHSGAEQAWETSCEIGLRSLVIMRTGSLVCAQYPLNLDGHRRIQIVHQNDRSLSAFALWLIDRLSGRYAHLIPSDVHDV